jgi:hypothetical protein
MKSQLWVHCACVRPHPSEQETVSKSLGLPDVVHGAADATGQVTRRNFGPGGAEVGEMGQGSRRSLAAAGCPVFPSSSLSRFCIRVEARGLTQDRANRPNANGSTAEAHPTFCTPILGDVVVHTDRDEAVLARGAILNSAGQIADRPASAALCRSRSKRILVGINH